MSTTTEVSADEATIVMSRIYDAQRDVVWKAITEAKHVAQWWVDPALPTRSAR